jgi:hypothetical protein
MKEREDQRLAERVGFEPTVPCGTHAFQACALSHSAISPDLPAARGEPLNQASIESTILDLHRQKNVACRTIDC